MGFVLFKIKHVESSIKIEGGLSGLQECAILTLPSQYMLENLMCVFKTLDRLDFVNDWHSLTLKIITK